MVASSSSAELAPCVASNLASASEAEWTAVRAARLDQAIGVEQQARADRERHGQRSWGVQPSAERQRTERQLLRRIIRSQQVRRGVSGIGQVELLLARVDLRQQQGDHEAATAMSGEYPVEVV